MSGIKDTISEEELELIRYCYDNLPLAICIQGYIETEDGVGDFLPVYANEDFCKEMNAPLEQILSVPLRVFAPNFPEKFMRDMAQIAFEGNKIFTESFPTPFRKYFNLSISQYKKGYVKLCMQDVTEKHVDAGALANLATAYVGVYYVRVLENVCFILYPDNHECQCIGFFDQIVEEHLNNKVVHPDNIKEVEKFYDPWNIKQVLRDKPYMELKYRRQIDGTGYKWCNAVLIPDEKVDDEVITFTLAIKVIDDIVKEEHEKQQELENAIQAEMRANQTKDKFLTHMSHDLRTPLNAIVGMLDIMEKNEKDMKLQRELRENIRVSANFLLSMFNDVLDMTRIEAKGIEEEKTVFDLHEIYIDRKISNVICKPFSCQNPIRIGTPIYLRQILFHLIENALKYNKEDGIVVLDMQEGIDVLKRDVVIISVADTGIGISQEFLPHIFEPFTQENADARTTYQGTGLGLAYVKKLVDLMDGTIDVESEVGKGSIFTVTIPMPIGKTEQMAVTPKEVDIAGKKILVVEDNEMNMFIIQSILEDEHIIVEKAENGKVAVEKFADSAVNEYDMIFMDIMMPVMNGLQAARTIRGLKRGDAKKIPILAISANTFPEDVEKSIEAGMNDHIAKPISTNFLIETIKKYLN